MFPGRSISPESDFWAVEKEVLSQASGLPLRSWERWWSYNCYCFTTYTSEDRILVCVKQESWRLRQTKVFVERILHSLKEMKPGDGQRLKSEIFSDAVKINSKRISYYIQLIKDDVKFLVNELSISRSVEDTPRRWNQPRWLRMLTLNQIQGSFVASTNPKGHAFNNRDLPTVLWNEALRWVCEPSATSCARSYLCPTIREHPTCRRPTEPYEESSKRCRSRWVYLPALFDDFEVMRIKSSGRSSRPLQQRNPSLNDIAGRMVSGPGKISRYRDALD